jgi:hypothetical protein
MTEPLLNLYLCISLSGHRMGPFFSASSFFALGVKLGDAGRVVFVVKPVTSSSEESVSEQNVSSDGQAHSWV